MLKRIVTASSLVALMTTAAWAQVPAGGQVLLNTYTTGDERRPQAITAKDGRFIVTWSSSVQDGNNFGQFAQRFDATGAPVGTEFIVNTYTIGYQAIPLFKGIAADDKNNFAVVWQDGTPTVNGVDGSLAGVFGQRFDSSGAKLGADFRVNTYTTGIQRWPRVAVRHDGQFVVVWQSNGQDGNAYGVFGQRFRANGAPLGPEFLVNTYTTGVQAYGNIGFARDNTFVVVWHSAQDGNGLGIFGQRFDANGGPVGVEFQVNSYTTGNQYFPSLAVAEDGSFVVAFFSSDGNALGVGARRFDPAGNALGADFVVNTYTTGLQFFPNVDSDELGNFTVSWHSLNQDGSAYGIFAQRFTAGGVARGTEFRVNTYTTASQLFPAVTADSVGNLFIAFESQATPADPLGFGAHAQRFGGLLPTALNMNSTGNLVWEPGETVDMRPSWRNVNGAPQTFAATLSNLTGPPGAIYTLVDGTGNYATVANNASALCTDCYMVTVDNPATRPVQHWDASAVESITPDAQGQQKQWRLHIGSSFTDVPTTNAFYRFIETLFHHGITGGCGGTNYCPSDPSSREQMAVFVLIAKEGPAYAPPDCTTPVFNDVPASSPFCRFIEELFRRGVVGGCGNGDYCPTSPVTREQMAVFVLRTLDPALNPPNCTTPIFNDVPATSPFCRWVEELFRRGVVSGCGGGNYCPTDAVSRQQMAVFISVTFGLTLYGL
jgi:hypothetical protein